MFLLILCAHLFMPIAAPVTLQRIGYAYTDSKHTSLLYTEQHTITYENNQIQHSYTQYFNTKKQLIAELDSDYTRNAALPIYTFHDFQHDIKEGLLFEKNNYVIFYQEKNKPKQTKRLTQRNTLFAAQAWHYYLKTHLEEAIQHNIRMHLIFPAKLDYYSFVIRTLKHDSIFIELRLEFEQWFIRLFAPHMDLKYNKQTQELVEYHGPSNLTFENQTRPNVYIVYK